MNLLRLQLGLSLVECGLRNVRNGKIDNGSRLIGRGLACLTKLLADIEGDMRRIA